MQVYVILFLCFVPAHLIPDINCIRTNPLVLEGGIDLFVHQMWDSDAAAEDVTKSINLLSSRFSRLHKMGITSTKTLKKVAGNLYKSESLKHLPMLITMKLSGTKGDLNERVELLKETKEAVVEANSVHPSPIIVGIYLHKVTGTFQMRLEAVNSVFGASNSSVFSTLQLGHFSKNCTKHFLDASVVKYLDRMDIITCEVLPSNTSSPEKSAADVIKTCDQIRDYAVAVLNLTAEILCRTEYYSQGTALSGIIGSLQYFQTFWCSIVEELMRDKNHARIIMWAAFDETSPDMLIDNEYYRRHDNNKAKHHTGWWRRSNSTEVGDFVEKVEDLPNCKRPCDFCNSENQCCDGMFCASRPNNNPAFCFTEGISCPALKSHSIESGTFDATTIAILSTVLLSVMFVSSLVGFIMYRRSTRIRILSPEELRRFFEGSSTLKVGDDLKSHELAEDLPYDTKLEVMPSDFEIYEDQILGSGSFGVVVKGRKKNDEVAVKTTQPGVAKIYLKALMTEMKVLMYLGQHENIVNLMGSFTIQLSSGKLYLFLELCSLGNLLGFLRSHRDSISNDDQSDDSSNKSEEARVSCKNLLLWSIQIANALKYLAEKQVIHGDIAARNILLFSLDQVKLTDFGLSRRLYEYSNYVKQNQEPLPWRHMSLEALRDLSFSVKSDVWAFGVTLWETFSLGEVPFPSQTWSEDFIQQLQGGLRPAHTKHAHALIYDVMKLCWTADVNSRPSIILIHTGLISAFDEIYLQYWRPEEKE